VTQTMCIKHVENRIILYILLNNLFNYNHRRQNRVGRVGQVLHRFWGV